MAEPPALTFRQYAMLFFPALVTGRLCDMGYFKHTLLFFRFVAPSSDFRAEGLRAIGNPQCVPRGRHRTRRRMQDVLAIAIVSRFRFRNQLWYDFWPSFDRHRTLVQAQACTGVRNRFIRCCYGRGSLSDCCSEAVRRRWVRCSLSALSKLQRRASLASAGQCVFLP